MVLDVYDVLSPQAIETMQTALDKAAAADSLPEGSKKYLQRRLQAFKAAQQKAASPAKSNSANPQSE